MERDEFSKNLFDNEQRYIKALQIVEGRIYTDISRLRGESLTQTEMKDREEVLVAFEKYIDESIKGVKKWGEFNRERCCEVDVREIIFKRNR